MFDIIIPVFNEEKILSEWRDYYSQLRQKAKIIFVDGGSTDQTANIAKKYGEVLSSKRGRSFQMNMGFANSQANDLLFLHVDTIVSDEAWQAMNDCMQNGVCGGCFTMKIDDRGFLFRIFENVVNFRARNFGVIDGDLGIFVKRHVFEELGKFAPIPIMEDILFSRKLRRAGNTIMLKQPILVSSRKWHHEGFGKTFLRYTWAYIQLWTKYRSITFK